MKSLLSYLLFFLLSREHPLYPPRHKALKINPHASSIRFLPSPVDTCLESSLSSSRIPLSTSPSSFNSCFSSSVKGRVCPRISPILFSTFSLLSLSTRLLPASSAGGIFPTVTVFGVSGLGGSTGLTGGSSSPGGVSGVEGGFGLSFGTGSVGFLGSSFLGLSCGLGLSFLGFSLLELGVSGSYFGVCGGVFGSSFGFGRSFSL